MRVPDKSISRKKDFWPYLCLLIPLLVFGCIAFFWDFYYDLNDDSLMASILSGTYTGTPALRNIQSYFPLTVFFGFLYRLFGAVNWYGIFLTGMPYLCLALVLFRICKLSERASTRIFLFALCALIFSGMMLYHLVFLQYSVVVGIMGAAASFLFLTMEPERSIRAWIRQLLPVALLIWCGYLLRSEMMLFVSPFIALSFLLRLGELSIPCGEGTVKSPGKGKVFLLCAAMIFSGLAVGWLCDQAGYASASWREFRDFFDARTQLYDFEKIPAYEGNEAFYESIGLDETQVQLIVNYNFGLDETIDAKVLWAVSDYADEQALKESSRAQRLKNALWDYRHSFMSSAEQPYNVIAVFLYMAIVLGLLGRVALVLAGKISPKGEALHLLYLAGAAVCVFACRSALLLYLYYNQRPVERLTHSIYLMEAVVLIWLLFKVLFDGAMSDGRKKSLPGSFRRTGGGLLFLGLGIVFAYALFFQVSLVQQEYSQREEINVSWKEFLSYCEEHPDNVYFTDVYSTVSYSEKVFEKLPQSVNYDLMGGWASKSPLEAQKFLYLGLCEEGDVQTVSTSALMEEAIYSDERCFVVAETQADMEWLAAYFAYRKRPVTLQAVDLVGDDWVVYAVLPAS